MLPGAVATILECVVVTTEDDARLHIRGSQTILIDGGDPFR